MNEPAKVKKVFYTVNDLHTALGGIVSKAYLYEMIKRNEIVSRRLGGKIVIPATWVDKFFADMTSLPDTANQKGF